MAQKAIQIVDFSEKILKRTTVLVKMKTKGLDLGLLKEFDLQQIMDCCNRLPAALDVVSICRTNIQQELIQNQKFAAYYAELLPLLPEEPPVEPDPTPVYNHRYGYRHSSYSAPKPPSRRSILLDRLCDLLEVCWESTLDITCYSKQNLMDTLALDQLTSNTRITYLENFVTMELSEEMKQTVVNCLAACISVPLQLDDWQKNLLLKPYVATRNLFATAAFEEICKLLHSSNQLSDILQLLHDHEIHESLCLEDYKVLAKNVADHYKLLSSILRQLGSENTSQFIHFWQNSQCSMDELRRMEHRIAADPTLEWESVLANYSGYINLLYGSRFKTMDLSDIYSYQEDILNYAIVHNKKHFIKLVDENAELFQSLPRNSLLLQNKLYEEHFNLNELTKKNLKAFQWMNTDNFDVSCLSPNRYYTFQELTALYDSPAVYIALYHLLSSNSQDYRLLVLRQLRKRNVIQSDMESGLPQLAEKLNTKPLQSWKEGDFSHIAGLTAEDTARMLIHFDTIKHLLPTMQCRTDVILVLKNLTSLAQFDSMSALKENILQFDTEWQTLMGELSLNEAFVAQHHESILRFLCNNGAYIARTYEGCLSPDHQEAFHRVVKAELMGQLSVLKYFEGDLQRELDAPLSERVKANWAKNLTISKGDMEVKECDDFFSTMLLGTQPYSTCLSYDGGAYRHCLLSAFDSNKKVLYVYLHGHIVGRAFLRLTKGRLTGMEKKLPNTDFTFVDLEHIADSHHEDTPVPEPLTLFLERPYISGVSPEQQNQVNKLLTELACNKANELGTMLVLSMSYHPEDGSFIQTKYAIYISKSKAGSQYLDSLEGAATVESEGSYKVNTFYVREGPVVTSAH